MAYKPNLDYLRQKESESQQRKETRSQGDLVWFNFANGQNLLRILPPWSEHGLYGMEVFTHYINQEQKFTCLKGYKGSLFAPEGVSFDCPFCEVLQEMKEKGQDPKGKWARFAVYLNVIDRKSGNLCIARFPGTLFDDFRATILSSWGDITDPLSGNDVIITKKGSGIDTEYNFLPARDQTPIFKRADGSPDYELIDNLLGNPEKQIPSRLYQLHQVWKYPKPELIADMKNRAHALKVFFLGTDPNLSTSHSGFSAPTSTDSYVPPDAPSVPQSRSTVPPPSQPAKEAPKTPPPATPTASTPPPAQPSKQAPPPPPKSNNVAEGRVMMPQASSTHTPPAPVQQEIVKPEGSPNCWGKAYGFDPGICSKCAYELTCKEVCSKK